jgi:hypothetical protein
MAGSAAWDGQVPPEDLYPEEELELFKNFEASTKDMSEPVPSYEESVARGLLQEELEERAAWGDGAKSPGKTSRSPTPPSGSPSQLEKMEKAMRTLEGVVGASTDEAARWRLTAGDRLGTMEDGQATLEEEGRKLKDRVLEAEEAIKAFKFDFDTWKEAVKKAFTSVTKEFENQGEALMKEWTDAQRKAHSSTIPSDLLRQPRIRGGQLFPARQGDSESSTVSVQGDDAADAIRDLRARLTWMEGVMRTRGAGGLGDGPPAFGNLGISCISDLAAWNAEAGSAFGFGFFGDSPLLLTFKRGEFTSVGDQLANLKRAGDVGLTQVQVRVLASFQNTLPEFFGKGLDVEGSSLPAMAKFSDWEGDDGITGAKFRLERALPLIQVQLESYINLYLTDDQRGARELASRCLSHSVQFVTRLSDFMSRTSRSLRTAGYKMDKVWAILSRQVLRIFEDLARARACAVDLAPPSNAKAKESDEGDPVRDHNAALAMWAVLKTHDVMQEYLTHNFEDHPSIAAENVRFLTYNLMGAGDNLADADLKAMEKKVDRLETNQKGTYKTVEKLVTRIDKLEKN